MEFILRSLFAILSTIFIVRRSYAKKQLSKSGSAAGVLKNSNFILMKHRESTQKHTHFSYRTSVTCLSILTILLLNIKNSIKLFYI